MMCGKDLFEEVLYMAYSLSALHSYVPPDIIRLEDSVLYYLDILNIEYLDEYNGISLNKYNIKPFVEEYLNKNKYCFTDRRGVIVNESQLLIEDWEDYDEFWNRRNNTKLLFFNI